jgi:hypothetical protein
MPFPSNTPYIIITRMMGSIEKKRSLVMFLKGLGAKTN